MGFGRIWGTSIMRLVRPMTAIFSRGVSIFRTGFFRMTFYGVLFTRIYSGISKLYPRSFKSLFISVGLALNIILREYMSFLL